MRYTDEKLLDALAREYVLGTLHGRARARFGRILNESLEARRAVSSWERRLAPLAGESTPVRPPSGTWAGIEAALGHAARPRQVPNVLWWQAAAAVFAAATVALGTLYLARGPSIEQPGYVAVINDEDAMPLWLVHAYAAAGELVVDTIDERPAPAGSSYELWTLPDDGSEPVSLGVISGIGETRVTLSEGAVEALGQSSVIAISLEPAGGSPTGAPTGPVLFTAGIIQS